MTKNRQQNGSLNRDLLTFLYRYGIFQMPPGESSCPGGSKYVLQRGVEGISSRVTGGRKKEKRILAVAKKWLPKSSILSSQT